MIAYPATTDGQDVYASFFLEYLQYPVSAKLLPIVVEAFQQLAIS
jgi:hypothetical protein